MSARGIGAIAAELVDRKGAPVHRLSFDVEDPRAKVFKRIGDGSAAEGFAHIGAMKETLKALIKQHQAEDYRPQKPGDPPRTQRTDYFVYDAILSVLDFATGALFPAYETIAAKAGVCRQVAIDAVKRLREHGFLDWVRRSIRTEEDDGPVRKQTSNAYFFDFRNRMAKRVWQTFLRALTRNLTRLGRAPAAAARKAEKPLDPGLSAALNALERAGEPAWSPSP